MDQTEKYLRELMYFISTTHLDIGGQHRYTLRPSAMPLITEIKSWLASQYRKETIDSISKRPLE